MSQGPAAFGAAGAGACGAADSLPPLIELKMAPTAWLATAEPAPKAIPAEEWIVGINFSAQFNDQNTNPRHFCENFT